MDDRKAKDRSLILRGADCRFSVHCAGHAPARRVQLVKERASSVSFCKTRVLLRVRHIWAVARGEIEVDTEYVVVVFIVLLITVRWDNLGENSSLPNGCVQGEAVGFRFFAYPPKP